MSASVDVASSPTPMRPAARRDLRILAAAVGLSAFGDELALTALMIKATELFAQGSGGDISYAGASSAVALILDRRDRPAGDLRPVRGLARGPDRERERPAGRLPGPGGARDRVGARPTRCPRSSILSFLLGTGATVASPATFTLIPAIVGSEHTTVANGWMESARYAGWVLGPVVAGSLSFAIGSEAALVFDACTFVVVALGATMLRAREPAAPGPRERPLQEALAGLRADPRRPPHGGRGRRRRADRRVRGHGQRRRGVLLLRRARQGGVRPGRARDGLARGHGGGRRRHRPPDPRTPPGAGARRRRDRRRPRDRPRGPRGQLPVRGRDVRAGRGRERGAERLDALA